VELFGDANAAAPAATVRILGRYQKLATHRALIDPSAWAVPTAPMAPLPWIELHEPEGKRDRRSVDPDSRTPMI